MKKIIALAIVCAMTLQGVGGVMAADEINTEKSSAKLEVSENAEPVKNTADNEDSDKGTDGKATENGADEPLQNDSMEDKSDTDTKEETPESGENSSDSEQENENEAADGEEEKDGEETNSENELMPTQAPTEVQEAKVDNEIQNGIELFSESSDLGTGNYSFDSAADIKGWTSEFAKISWDSTVDATENGGGSMKFEYDIRSGVTGNYIKVGMSAKSFFNDLADGECYTIKYKVFGGRVNSGADTYLNITTTDEYKDAYYQIACAASDKVKIEKNQWQTVTLDYIHNPTTKNIELIFPNGLSKQKNADEYDIYYIDDITIEKHDTIAPYAEAKNWFNAYKGTSKLLVGSVNIDISETSSLMQPGDTQTVVLYESDGAAGQTGSEIKRTRLTNDRFTFSSEYTDIAEIDENGTITAKSAGYTVITATTGSGANQKSARLLLTVAEDIHASGNYVVDGPNNILGRVEDFTGMRDYVYMTFCERSGDQNAAPSLPIDIKTPHIASFITYDAGTGNFDMCLNYGKVRDRMFEGGGSNQYYKTEYRWLNVPGVKNYISNPRREGWHQITVIVDYPTEHSLADGYMTKTIYIDGVKIGSGDFDCKPYSGNITFWLSKNQLVKEAYVVKCGTDFNMKKITPNISSGKLFDSGSSFTFEFSNKINPETVENNIQLSDDVQNIYFNYEIDGKTLVIKPEYPLDTEKEYFLTLRKDIAAVAKGASVPGSLDTDRRFKFSTNEYPVTYKENIVRANKINGVFTNNSNEDIDVYYVFSVYKDKSAQSVKIYEGTLPAGGSETVKADMGVDKISDCDGYEAAVFERKNGKQGELLYNVPGNTFSAIYNSTDISPKDETSVLTGYDPEKELVEITGQSKVKRMNMPVIMKMYKADSDENDKEYSRISVIRTGKNGEINYSFKMPQKAEKGIYKIELTMPFEDAEIDREINYIDMSDAKAYLEELDKQTTAEGVAAADIFNPKTDPLKILDDDFNGLVNKNFVYNSVLQGKPFASVSQNAVSNFKNLYRNAVKIASALEGEADVCVDIIKENHGNGYWGIAENSAYKSFIQNFDETKQKAVINKLKGAVGYRNVGGIFNAAVIVEDVLSQKSYTTVYSVLAGYGDVHGINFKDYTSLSESGKNSVAESFYKALKSAPSDVSVKDIKDMFEKYAKEQASVKEPSGESGSGNGSGNSGGTSGGNKSGIGYDFIIKSDSNVGKTPDWYEDESKSENIKVFDDLENAKWAEYSINKLYNLGAISGKAERVFAPNDNIKREELCQIIAKAFKLTAKSEAGTVPFADVEPGKWYTESVEICYQNGVINGIGDNLFGVGRTVTREEISAILVRAAEAAGKTLDYYFTIFPFSDEDQISDWAKNSVAVLHECLIIIGMEDGTFAPKDNVTRAQAAKMIAGLLDFNY